MKKMTFAQIKRKIKTNAGLGATLAAMWKIGMPIHETVGIRILPLYNGNKIPELKKELKKHGYEVNCVSRNK
jgi:hypothetical protein